MPANTDVKTRGDFLKHLRAVCARRVRFFRQPVALPGQSELPTDMELLRLFFVNKFPGEFTPSDVQCRHFGAAWVTAIGSSACFTAGTRESGKAARFVKTDFVKRLRAYLDHLIAITPHPAPAFRPVLDESDEEDDNVGEVKSEDEEIVVPGSFDPNSFLSSDPSTRLSTKQNLGFLFWLASRAHSPVVFAQGYRELLTQQELMHLCGCGIAGGVGISACVNPAHLRLGSHKENQVHKAYHQILRSLPVAATPGVQGQVLRGDPSTLLAAWKGSRPDGFSIDDLL
jgi:hypothetical protein